ncbi:MAG: DUF72 domain-containing protein [Thermoplasmatota archaeon]
MATVSVGCSGWSYQHWRGDFYPKDLPARLWLESYGRSFSTVEINNSFYRIPRKEIVAQWCDRTPGGFTFSYKLWRGLTHFAHLVDKRRPLRSFLGVQSACPPLRRATLLVHLPPQMRCDEKRMRRLDGFLEDAERMMGRSPWRVAVEFRHSSWDVPAVRRLLDGHDAAFCLHDMAGCKMEEPNDASLVYVRRHGVQRYSGAYSPRMLRHDARRIEDWMDEGRDVVVYFNNDLGGHAPRDATRLRALLGQDETVRQRPLAARKPATARPGSVVATTGTSSGSRER